MHEQSRNKRPDISLTRTLALGAVSVALFSGSVDNGHKAERARAETNTPVLQSQRFNEGATYNEVIGGIESFAGVLAGIAALGEAGAIAGAAVRSRRANQQSKITNNPHPEGH